MDQFPAAQTEGRTRQVNTVASNPFTGWIYKPTAPEVQSIFETPKNYIDNYGGSIATAESAKDILSQDKAVKIGNKTNGFIDTLAGVLESASKTAKTWKTYADQLLGNLKVQDVHPGSTIPGPVPSPTIIHYGAENNMDQRIDNLKKTGQSIVEQVKGLFNLAYEGPIEPTVSTQPTVGGQPQPIGSGQIGIVVLLFLVLFTLSK